MSFLAPKIKTPAAPAIPDPVAPVDQTDVQNRQASARLRRLAFGGSGTTILGSAMGATASQASPRAALTGIGG